MIWTFLNMGKIGNLMTLPPNLGKFEIQKQDQVVNSLGSKMLLEFGIAQLSLSLCVLFSCCSRYVAFLELIHLNDLLVDVTFLFLTDQKPRKIYRRMDDRRTTEKKGTYRILPSWKKSSIQTLILESKEKNSTFRSSTQGIRDLTGWMEAEEHC